MVIGLRADFYTHCARHPSLVEALQDAQVLVGPMRTDELAEAVTKPAARAGLMVEKTLVTTVVHEAAERPGTQFSPDGRHLVTSGTDGTFRVWDISRGTATTSDRIGTTRYEQVALSPDGTLLAAATGSGAVLIRSVDGDGEPTVLRGHRGQALAVEFSPDGRRLVSGGRDGTVRIWSVDGDAPPIVLHGPKGGVRSVAFSPDGKHVVTTGQNGKVYLWSTSGNPEPTVYSGYQANVMSATFSPDGRRLLTTHDDGTVRVQQCDVRGSTEETLALAETRTTRQLTADERKTFGL